MANNNIKTKFIRFHNPKDQKVYLYKLKEKNIVNQKIIKPIIYQDIST